MVTNVEYVSATSYLRNAAVCVKIPYAIRRVLISEKRSPRFPPHVERERKMRFLSSLGHLDPDGE
eukprot:1213662-Ditylum_brightwellii.AAC.1